MVPRTIIWLRGEYEETDGSSSDSVFPSTSSSGNSFAVKFKPYSSHDSSQNFKIATQSVTKSVRGLLRSASITVYQIVEYKSSPVYSMGKVGKTSPVPRPIPYHHRLTPGQLPTKKRPIVAGGWPGH